MSKVVYKYPMVFRSGVVVVPIGKVVLVGQDASNTLCVWVELDTRMTQTMTLRVFGTGAEVPDHYTHVASFTDLPYIWHVYRVNNDDYSRTP